MKKNEIFTFTAPNGVVVTAVVIDFMGYNVLEHNGNHYRRFLCYAQNRLFDYFLEEEYTQFVDEDGEENGITRIVSEDYGEVIVDYCILPDYDAMLEAYSDHQVTLAEEQSGM